MNELRVWAKATLSPNRADPHWQGRTVEPPTDEQDKDYWLMRKYRAQALQQEGELLDASAVMRAWTQTVGDIRDQLLLLPAAVQGLIGLDDEQARQLDDFLKRTLDGIADRMGDLASDSRTVPSSGKGDKAAQAAEPESVGGNTPVHATVDDGESRSVEK
ncbi:MAG: hypothetical protein AAGC72_15010 [Planctomycetota bacterium]